MKTYDYILRTIEERGAAYLILIDPDRLSRENLPSYLSHCELAGVDGFLVGGSLLIEADFSSYIQTVKKLTKLPVIIFPGSVNQVAQSADALLFLSLISGRNAEHLIGKHVIAAPMVKQFNLETISTGYMLIESGTQTTAQYISGSSPIPRNKNEIAVATALAAQYLGMKLIYLEAGSGAQNHVPIEMIKAVTSSIDVPVIVGGGIRDAQTAANMVANGAKIIVTGNFFEDNSKWDLIKNFADAIHQNN